MAVSTSAVNLATYALLSNNPAVKEVTFSLIDNGSIMARDIPFINKKTLTVNGRRWEGNLPTVSWSQLNAEGVTSQGVPKAFSENAYVIRNYIDADKFIVEDENEIMDPREAQVQAYLKAVAYDFNFRFIKNDHTSGDINSLLGLRYRIDNPTLSGVNTQNKIDAGGLDMTLATLTAAATKDGANKLIESLDYLLWAVDSPSGEGVVLYMNDWMKRRIATGLRALGTDGGYSQTTDNYGRIQDTYRGAVLMDVGFKADQTTRIIAGNSVAGSGAVGETAAGADSTGASATFTSIYAVNYSPGHMMGWQFDVFNVQDLGLLNNGTIYRTLLDWAGGLNMQHTRCIARLYDIKLA